MEKITIQTTEGVIRGIQYCNDLNINEDLAILYLTILLDAHSKEELLEPIPIWIFGFKDVKKYLQFFCDYNLIHRFENSYSVYDFIIGCDYSYEISDPKIIKDLFSLSTEIHELDSYLKLAS